MSELSVTEDQRRRLEAVCDDLEEAFVGPYGSVTPADALEYLLDTYTPPEEAGAESVGDREAAVDRTGPGISADRAGRSTARESSSPPVAVGTTDRPGRDGTDAQAADSADDDVPDDDATQDDEARGETDDDLTAIDGVGEVTAGALSAAGFDSVSAIRAADPEALTAAEGVGEKQAVDISAAAQEAATGEAGGSDTGASGADEGGAARSDEDAAPGAVSAEQTLQQAESLLDAHDDRWREGTGDEPYEVDLPDGSTEGARTRDDVKRLLFKHWR